MKRPAASFTVTPVERELTPDAAASLVDFALGWVQWRDELVAELKAALIARDDATAIRLGRMLTGLDEAELSA